MNNNEGTTITQILNVTKTILEQNYFQYNEAIFKPKKGIAMGSPISGTMAEAYLQYVESTHIKQRWETGEISLYKRYVDDILIIYDSQKINNNIIEQKIYTIDNNIEFKMTTEENNAIDYLDLTLHKQRNKIELSIHRKPTSTTNPTTPTSKTMAAFRFYIHRMTMLPITTESRREEWKTIVTMAEKMDTPDTL